jgi:hypothetical protein
LRVSTDIPEYAVMATQPADYDRAIRTAKRGRLVFLAIAVLAAASGPVGAYLTGCLDVTVLLGGLIVAGAAFAVGLPIFHREIRRLHAASLPEAEPARVEHNPGTGRG